jgi:hypothetical protein
MLLGGREGAAGRKAIRYIQLENKLQSGYHYDVADDAAAVK